MTNIKIRHAMMDLNVKQYELAKMLGISVNTLVRKMREELPEAEQDEIIALMKKERG